MEKILEQYTLKNSQEVLLVSAEINGKIEEIIIFKGFSSSLTQSTAFDPDISILPANSIILKIDIIQSPYNPDNIKYIEKNLSWQDFQFRLS